MIDWTKNLPHAVATPELTSIVTLQEAADYARRKASPSWQWARRQLTRAAAETSRSVRRWRRRNPRRVSPTT